MFTTFKTRLIKIGNSQGVRIPKPLLRQANLGEEIILETQPHQIIIRPARLPRQDWDGAFQAMAERHDDEMLDEDMLSTQWDEEEWEW